MLHSAVHSNKRIFAPTGGSSDPGHAVQYKAGALNTSDLAPTPTAQFHTWFNEALSAGVYQPETVTLSTCSLPDGKPSARMVFMKELDDRGFVVYTNMGTSRKAADMASNPQAALTFWWREMERQVRVEGHTERLTSEESQDYYDTRIRGSKIGAWASPQSQVLEGREELERRVDEVEKSFEGEEKIPVPDFWGGVRVVPEAVEFWQGRERGSTDIKAHHVHSRTNTPNSSVPSQLRYHDHIKNTFKRKSYKMCPPKGLTSLGSSTTSLSDIPSTIPPAELSQSIYAHAAALLHPFTLNHSICLYIYIKNLAAAKDSTYHTDLAEHNQLFVACLFHDIGTRRRTTGRSNSKSKVSMPPSCICPTLA
ncbi:hypothetical protein PMIN02_009193 [Paraphaeosphaeria minitans]